ncbi:hypothetical protein [Pseudomonas aeruginosa]|uniref:hypothetical protein n=1 Tax=Pseudomonas aeruginosa TaxID=287 RepID=UPI001F4A73E9|nr:hypothetical protein [Pseudomonas aeruginosa]MCS7693323.1 hypothetical protein [Pseudomonas aeruginosa]HCE7942340.1 hypothetical protein [Pseudomonas aeruginosa]HCF0264800.1 hypothetical protein [Pseudomonas aeruginosa]
MLKISSAVVVDDALGPPATGAVVSEDKGLWLEFVVANESAQQELSAHFSALECSSLEELLELLLSERQNLTVLWERYREGQLSGAGLDVLFRTEELNRLAKAEKASLVGEALASIIGDDTKVLRFSDLQSASASLMSADVAFIDFFLKEDESEDEALTRIKSSSALFANVKLIFFMSSRASLETQQVVRELIGIRTAFFEVMSKADINVPYIKQRLELKAASYESNQALEAILDGLTAAAHEAAEEFKRQSKTLEVHDLRLLDLFRLKVEGQSLSEYLTWLFSEALAAKTRRLGLPKASKAPIEEAAISFTGEILQQQVLFDFFSEVVFSPSLGGSTPFRFGEVFRLLKEPERYFLVLTPACDLIRCSSDKNLLCVEAMSLDYSSPLAQSKEKLFGKHGSGLRHLLKYESDGVLSSRLLMWQKDVVHTFKVGTLLGGEFERMALMNELFAHEVKEEVLRELGRVGTSINPAPPFTLNAHIRWQHDGVTKGSSTPDQSFISALLTYSEQPNGSGRKPAPAVVFSDKFKDWVLRAVNADLAGEENVKLKNCLSALEAPQFQLSGEKWSAQFNDLFVCVRSEPSDQPLGKVLLEITLLVDDS